MTNLDASEPAVVDYRQEMRFAVVMYGGSSLAIYMNGVAQELLRLVRSTAPAIEDESSADGSGRPGRALIQEVTGSEAVYRKLGRMLSTGQPKLGLKDDESAPIRTRFVIDILSGTSAGGINAVFLAKALANNEKMEQLKQMWIEQGDIGVLMNDKESDADINLGPQDPPRSLLNSRRMYYQLLSALEGMDAEKRKETGRSPSPEEQIVSPFIEELDLFTTATDIWGQQVNIRLADGVARERRHLNTFHFRFSSKEVDGSGQNDFTPDFNPFLAFAARVTSAHPAPFEPMKLADIDEVLNRHEAYRNIAGYRSDDPRWEAFFEDYLHNHDDRSDGRGEVSESGDKQQPSDKQSLKAQLAKDFRKRPFSDGGVLDNSPFTFAIDKLQFRHTQLPVDRKLVYIEPVPEHPEEEMPSNRPPDALANAWLSLSVLPSYQFIRDDLQRLLDRNSLIERVNGIIRGVVDDERARIRKGDTQQPLSSYQFGKATLGEMIDIMGSAWGGYQRLRVAETTDGLVKLLAGAAGFEQESVEFLAIRYLVRAWRDAEYHPYGSKDPKPDAQESTDKIAVVANDIMARPELYSQNWFLYQYDFKWRLRRLRFVLNKIDQIACLDKEAIKILGIKNTEDEALALIARVTDEESQPAPAAAAPGAEGSARPPLSERERMLVELRTTKRKLGRVLRDLHIEQYQLSSRTRLKATRPQLGIASEQSADQTRSLAGALEALGQKITSDKLQAIVKKTTDVGRANEAKRLFVEGKEAFDAFIAALNAHMGGIMDRSSKSIRGDSKTGQKGILELPDKPTEMTPEYLVRRTLLYLYENFDRYDMISYPILYATNVGEETDVVDVFRISPEDARTLVEKEEDRRRKLAGTSLGNFGAFFDRDFRINDILWGRLDCADRIITALLSSASPQNDEEQKELERVRRELVEEASRAIIIEELGTTDNANLRALLASAMKDSGTAQKYKEFVTELGKVLEARPTPETSKVQDLLQQCLGTGDPLQQFIRANNFNHELPPKVMVQTSARASRVFGKMLEGIAEIHRVDKKRVVWVTRLAQLFWGLVEVAVPDSIPNLIFQHWLKLLYLFEVLLVVGGTLLLNQPIQQFGFAAFAVTALLHLIVRVLSDSLGSGDELEITTTGNTTIVKKKRQWLSMLKTAAIVIGVILAALGALLAAAILWSDALASFIHSATQTGEATQVVQTVSPAPTSSVRVVSRWVLIAVVILVFLGSIRDDLKRLVKR